MPKCVYEQLSLIPCETEDKYTGEEITLEQRAEWVRSEADLISFVYDLRDDFLEDPEGWQNPDLEQFLDALATCTAEILLDSFSGGGSDSKGAGPSWKIFAQILIATKYYPEDDVEQ